jgi:hypothetical protein
VQGLEAKALSLLRKVCSSLTAISSAGFGINAVRDQTVIRTGANRALLFGIAEKSIHVSE